MTPVPNLLLGITHHSTEWWAEKDRLITERARRRVRGSSWPTAVDRAEERDRQRIEEAQTVRDHPTLRKEFR